MRDVLYKIELAIARFVLWFYALPDDPIEKCDAVFPHGYGCTRDSNLIHATIVALEKSLDTAKAYPKSIIFLTSENYSENERRRQDALKIGFILGKCRTSLNREMLPEVIIVEAGAKNTIGEVENTLEMMERMGKRFNTIVVVCDRAQMRRAKIIWRHYCPEKTILMLGFEGYWRDKHPLWWLRSPLRWIAVNMIHHFLLWWNGVDKMATKCHTRK